MLSLGESVWGFCGPRVQSLPESGARGKDLDIGDRWIDSVSRFNKALLSYYILRRLVRLRYHSCGSSTVSFLLQYSLGAAPLGDAPMRDANDDRMREKEQEKWSQGKENWESGIMK